MSLPTPGSTEILYSRPNHPSDSLEKKGTNTQYGHWKYYKCPSPKLFCQLWCGPCRVLLRLGQTSTSEIWMSVLTLHPIISAIYSTSYCNGNKSRNILLYGGSKLRLNEAAKFPFWQETRGVTVVAAKGDVCIFFQILLLKPWNRESLNPTSKQVTFLFAYYKTHSICQKNSQPISCEILVDTHKQNSHFVTLISVWW